MNKKFASVLITVLSTIFLSSTAHALDQCDPNEFMHFWDTFLSDSAFAKKHTKFPLVMVEIADVEEPLDTTLVSDSAWTKPDLDWFKNSSRQAFILCGDGKTARVYYRGIDSGISVTFYFKLIDKEWFYVRYENMST
jgi:hypothetical protein